MTRSGYTDQVIHTNYCGPRTTNAGIDYIIIHHMASTNFAGVLRMWTHHTRPGSAHYAISNEGKVVNAVDERLRAWSVANAYWDSRSIVFEVENLSTRGWTISSKAFNSTVDVCADLCKRYGISPDRIHIFGHGELYARHRAGYATACPGGFNLNALVNAVRSRLGKGGLPPAQSGSQGGTNYPSGTRFGYALTKVQWRVNNMGYRPALVIDGVQGPATTAGIKWAQKKLGVAVDGKWGNKTQAAYDKWSKKHPGKTTTKKAPKFPLPKGWYFGPKSGPKQSVSGYFGHREDLRRWQKQMEKRGWDFSRYGCDGLYGAETAENARAFQREKGLVVDGKIGPKTWGAAWTAPIT